MSNELLATGTDEPWSSLEEFESDKRAERTMTGHEENVEALPYVCDCGETQTMSHLMT